METWDDVLEALPRQRAWVEIDLDALARNVTNLRRSLNPTTDLLAVVKADAYGHGAVSVARVALQAGATWLGVATVTEGVELRRAGITAPILLLGAAHSPEEVRAIAHWQIQPTLVTPQQAQVFSDILVGLGRSLPVHLKLDTGMSRLGMPWEEAVTFVAAVQALPQLTIASLYSHLATADDPDPTVMRLQHQRYEAAIATLRAQGIALPRLHLANTAATLADPRFHYDMVRVGLGLYGLYPAPHLRLNPGEPSGPGEPSLKGTASAANPVALEPVLRVQARVTQVRAIAAGTGVSYGHRFVAPRDMTMAVIGIGYADGVHRRLSNQMQVLVQGQRVPQIGAITMDQMMLDVSQLGSIQPGQVVTLLGGCGHGAKNRGETGGETGEENPGGATAITVDEWAERLDTISWEILCSFKHRLPRIEVRGCP